MDEKLAKLKEKIESLTQEEKIESLTQVITQNPNDWELFLIRGGLFYSRGLLLDKKEDFDSAIADFTITINKNPDAWNGFFCRGMAYHNRGEILHSTEDFDLAIADFITTINKNPDDWMPYISRAYSYNSRGYLLHSKKDYDSAIADFTTAINKNPNFWETYEGRGTAYLNRGALLKNKNDWKNAVFDCTDSLSRNGEQLHCYYLRASAFWLCSKYNESIEDLNAYLYYSYRKLDEKEIKLDGIERIFETEPFNHWTLILSLVQSNKFSSGLMAKYIDLQEPLYDFLLILKYLGFNPNALSSTNEYFLRIIPILLYHLNGSVTTFRLFDECLDGNIKLTSMEHYYYVRSALQFAPECRADIGALSLPNYAIDAIESFPDKTAEDWYYLGLLYYLKGMETTTSEEERHTFEENALNCLEKAVDFVWAKALIERLEPDSYTYGVDFTNYIEQHCNSQRSIDIEPLTDFKSLIPNKPQTFLHQFNDFIHLHEVMDILPYSGPHVEYCNSLWEVFSLKDADCSSLKDKMTIKSATDIFSNLVDEKKAKGVEALSEEENQRVEDDFHQYVTLTDEDAIIRNLLKDMFDENGLNRSETETILKYLASNKKISIENYLLLGYYYDSCMDNLNSGQLLACTAELIMAIIKFAIAIPVSLGDFKNIAPQLGGKMGFSSSMDLRREYRDYSNFKEFVKNKWRVTEKDVPYQTDEFDVILL